MMRKKRKLKWKIYPLQRKKLLGPKSRRRKEDILSDNEEKEEEDNKSDNKAKEHNLITVEETESKIDTSSSENQTDLMSTSLSSESENCNKDENQFSLSNIQKKKHFKCDLKLVSLFRH